MVAGCTGLIGEAPEEEPRVEAPCESAAGRVVARRLSRTEYDNTVRDLFAFDVGRPSDTFPDDVAGLDGLTVSDLFLQSNEEVAGRLAALAVENGFIVCEPTEEARACARRILAPFMKRAWRRPVTSEEVDGILRYLDVVAQEPSEAEPFRRAIELGIQHVLMSPSFLFRFEPLDDPSSPEAQRLGAYELASRLSYFIWDSMPDPALFAAADSGTLTEENELAAHVERMLTDAKAEALVGKLAGGWLWADRLELLNPKPAAYPTYDQELRRSLKQELALFVGEFLREDRSFRDMLDADFTYANARLAEHYGLPGAFTSELKRVSLAGVPERGGLLTQGAVLAATSVAHNDSTAEVSETNVIVRGRFVLEQLLCTDLPPPPPDLDVGQIQAEAQQDIPDTAPRKEREGVRQSTLPCSGCHKYLDPIGFSMEHFDVTGAFRTLDSLGTAVDTTGALLDADGAEVGSFDDARGLGSLLKRDPRVSECLTEKVLKMALGRNLRAADQCHVRQLAERSDEQGNGLRALVVAITRSTMFTHQRGEAP